MCKIFLLLKNINPYSTPHKCVQLNKSLQVTAGIMGFDRLRLSLG